MKRILAIIAFTTLSTLNALAQQQQQKDNQKNTLISFDLYGNLKSSNQTLYSIDKAFIPETKLAGCKTPPTQEVINTNEFVFTDHMYDASQAIKLGIPVVNISGSHSLKLYVRDYRRTASCLGDDNKTEYSYGQVIRTVIEIENYDASAGVDLASIAASGTLKKSSQKFYFYKTGFFNAQIDSIIANVSGKTFDVENYALYQNVMSAVIGLLNLKSTTFNPSLIGVVSKIDLLTSSLEEINRAPIISYALTCIYQLDSYQKSIKKFIGQKEIEDLIKNIYSELKCPLTDERPGNLSKAMAESYLKGLKTK